LLALIVLVGLVLAGLYYWRRGDLGTNAAASEGLSEVGSRLGQVGQTVGDSLRDTKLTGQVRAALEINRALEPYDFDVTTEQEVVVLRGEVPTEELRRTAEQVAAGVPEVKGVRNEVRVAYGSSPADPPSARRSVGENIDDRALEAKVRMSYSLNRGMAGSDVKVTAFKREVTLSGTVAGEAQRQLAVALARDTAGVAGVKDQIAGGAGAPVAAAPPGTAMSDRARAAQAALAANPSLAGYGLTVREESGRLLLAGSVRTAAERDLAALMARDAAGMPVDSIVTIRH
jgi:osmotically-inducible protein OsmY